MTRQEKKEKLLELIDAATRQIKSIREDEKKSIGMLQEICEMFNDLLDVMDVAMIVTIKDAGAMIASDPGRLKSLSVHEIFGLRDCLQETTTNVVEYSKMKWIANSCPARNKDGSLELSKNTGEIMMTTDMNGRKYFDTPQETQERLDKYRRMAMEEMKIPQRPSFSVFRKGNS